MTEIPGVETQARPMPLVIVADVSLSMQGQKISALNQSLRALVQDLEGDRQTKASVRLSLITFGAQVLTPLSLQPLEGLQLPELQASGETPMGAAFKVALSELSDAKGVTQRWLRPLIVLASDGQPNDTWEEPLKELIQHPRVGRAGRLALAIGSDADRNVLQRFVSDEFPIVEANAPEKIKTFFRWVTYATRANTVSVGTASVPKLPVDDLMGR